MSETKAVVGTHGDVATHFGDCETCGRQGVSLKANWNRKAECWHFTCVDQFACATMSEADGCDREHSPATNAACSMRPEGASVVNRPDRPDWTSEAMRWTPEESP